MKKAKKKELTAQQKAERRFHARHPNYRLEQQRRLREEGKCRACWQPSEGHVYCAKCRKRVNARARAYLRKRHGKVLRAWRKGRRGRPIITSKEAKKD